MGAWIEIFNPGHRPIYIADMSHPTMGAWIEIFLFGVGSFPSRSHPTMGAWIEILILL